MIHYTWYCPGCTSRCIGLQRKRERMRFRRCWKTLHKPVLEEKCWPFWGKGTCFEPEEWLELDNESRELVKMITPQAGLLRPYDSKRRPCSADTLFYISFIFKKLNLGYLISKPSRADTVYQCCKASVLYHTSWLPCLGSLRAWGRYRLVSKLIRRSL